jgi:hypothetical protein
MCGVVPLREVTRFTNSKGERPGLFTSVETTVNRDKRQVSERVRIVGDISDHMEDDILEEHRIRQRVL